MQFLVSKTQSSNKETKNYTSLWINGMKTQKRRQKIDHLEVWRSESWVKRDKNNPRTWITSKKCIIKTKLTNNLRVGIPASQTTGGVGIFTVKMPFFSGKTAENVMGVYGFDCPAIFWDLECSHFWGVAEGVLVHLRGLQPGISYQRILRKLPSEKGWAYLR